MLTWLYFNRPIRLEILLRMNKIAWWRQHIFGVTGPLWGESTGHQWMLLTKASYAELWCLIWSTNGWAISQYATDLRRHRAHYDVTVMGTLYLAICIRLDYGALQLDENSDISLPPLYLSLDPPPPLPPTHTHTHHITHAHTFSRTPKPLTHKAVQATMYNVISDIASAWE